MKTWKFGGYDLSDYGTLTTVSSVFKLLEKRGDNILIPFADGRTFVRKFYEQQLITLGLAVDGSGVEDLEFKIDLLKRILGRSAQGLLQQVFDNESIRQAYAEVRGNLSPARISPTEVRMAIDFLITDPFMRSNVLTSVTQLINGATTAYNLNNPGSAEERKAIITLTGPLSHPVITNTGISPNVSLQYDDVLASNTDIVRIDCGAFSAVDETAASVVSKIVHTGDPAFMVLIAGINALSVADGTHTSGTVKFEFYAPYL